MNHDETDPIPIPDGYEQVEPPAQLDPLHPLRDQRLPGVLLPGETIIGSGPGTIIIRKKNPLKSPAPRLVDRLKKSR